MLKTKKGTKQDEESTHAAAAAAKKDEPLVTIQDWRALVPALALLLGLGGPNVATAGDATDTQLWNEAKLTIRLNNRFDVVAGGVLRLGDDISQVIRNSGLVGANARVTDFLSLTPTYQYIADHPVQGEPTVENRLGLVSTLSTPIRSANLALSNGLEFRSFDNKPDSWRWRPKLKVSHPLGSTTLGLSIYIADELFYEFIPDSWTRNRLFAGLEKRLSDNVAIELYYCRQTQFKAGQQDLNIIGVASRIDFDPGRK